MSRNALAAALQCINRMNDLAPQFLHAIQEITRAIQHERLLLEARRGPAAPDEGLAPIPR